MRMVRIMKKQFTTLFFALLLTFSLAAVCFAEEKQAEAPVDPNATNLTAVYPVLEDAVPAMPVKPESLKDAKAVTAYIAAVDSYLKAVQKYIDGTTNDLNKIIEQRTDRKGIGFDAVVESKAERRTGQLLKEVQPHDLLKFGIIPELVGRMPVMVTLNGLGRDDLVQILTQPKNALVKQYQKLLEYDDVELQFQPEALDAVADQAIQRNIGARGLRAVMEGLLTRIMYEIPSDPTITRVTITPEAVLKTGEPEITRDPQRTERPGRTRDGKAEHDPSAPAS